MRAVEAGGSNQLVRNKGDLHPRLGVSGAMGTCTGSAPERNLWLTQADSPLQQLGILTAKMYPKIVPVQLSFEILIPNKIS